MHACMHPNAGAAGHASPSACAPLSGAVWTLEHACQSVCPFHPPPPSLCSQAYIFVATASEKQWGAGEGTLRKMLKSFKA